MKATLADRLRRCECCPRGCGVNRHGGQVGFCRISASTQISYAGLHFGEEPPISGTRGSGTIFFPGCNLRCVFCQNFQISQEWQQGRIRTLTTEELASEMLRLQNAGAHNINFVSPSHMVFQTAEAIEVAKGEGLAVPVVYNSNGYDSVESLRQIRGLVDIYLPDIKYMNNGLGKHFSAVSDYADIVPGALREMLDQVGHLRMNGEGIAVRGLLVRHLVLPGHMADSRRCLDLLAELSLDTCVSLMSQYSPQHRACEYPGINRKLTQEEYDRVLDFALQLGLENVYIQELESQEHCLPDFALESPFKFA